MMNDVRALCSISDPNLVQLIGAYHAPEKGQVPTHQLSRRLIQIQYCNVSSCPCSEHCSGHRPLNGSWHASSAASSGGACRESGGM